MDNLPFAVVYVQSNRHKIAQNKLQNKLKRIDLFTARCT